MVDLLCVTPSSCWVLCPSGGQGTAGKIIIFPWNGFLLLFYRVIDFFRNFALRIKIIKEIIMLTLKLISEETERVIKGLEKKHFNGAREAVEKVLEYDRLRRETQQKLDTNKQQQNQLSKQIGGLMKEGKTNEANDIKEKVAELKSADKALHEIMETAQREMTEVLLTIPNVPNDDVPEGKDANDNVVVKEGGEKPNLPADAQCHWDLLKKFILLTSTSVLRSPEHASRYILVRWLASKERWKHSSLTRLARAVIWRCSHHWWSIRTQDWALDSFQTRKVRCIMPTLTTSILSLRLRFQ